MKMDWLKDIGMDEFLLAYFAFFMALLLFLVVVIT